MNVKQAILALKFGFQSVSLIATCVLVVVLLTCQLLKLPSSPQASDRQQATWAFRANSLWKV